MSVLRKKAKKSEESPKSDLAMAVNVSRMSKKPKKMADGGIVKADKPKDTDWQEKHPGVDAFTKGFNEATGTKKMAHGGEVMASDLMDDDERASSIADAIRRKRLKTGEVDIESNGMEESNMFDEINADAVEDPIYDDSQLSEQPEDSNEHGQDVDDGSLASKIRRKLRSKSG